MNDPAKIAAIIESLQTPDPTKEPPAMTDEERRPQVYAAAKAMFDGVSSDIRGDLVSALEWAQNTLRDHEGSGHHFSLIHENGGFKCCFAKPQWNADHCSQAMPEAPEAIVMAVCEYLNGV